MIDYQDQPAVLVVADTEAGRVRWLHTAEVAGCRVIDAISLEAAAERLTAQAAPDAVLADLQGDCGDALDVLLKQLDRAADSRKYASLVHAPFAMLDRIAALTAHQGVNHLCDPGEWEQAAAVARVIEQPSSRLHDVNKDQAVPRLRQISEEVGRIATILASLSDEAADSGQPVMEHESSGETRLEPGFVRAIIRARRVRDQFFRTELFADPAWDMLLDLLAARLENQRVAVSSLCIAAAVPPTTALRWIKTLTDLGLFVRVADPQDGRRVFIELSDEAAKRMESCLSTAQRISPLAI